MDISSAIDAVDHTRNVKVHVVLWRETHEKKKRRDNYEMKTIELSDK